MKNLFLKLKKNFVIVSLVLVSLLLIITGFLFNSFALPEPVSSISFTSNKLNYETKEPGSWKVEKSAKWISPGKARITFQVDTVLKTEDKARDIIFVLDISGSMAGDKLERVKQDSKELIASLLEDSNNRAALITFDTYSKILSNLTNDKDDLINKIDGLEFAGATNYYQALVNVENVLKGYTKEENRELIALFLTDGYPCEDVPNEIAQYNYLKEQYPYLTISGVQYEMGSDILDPIKKISDNYFIADMDNLNNVLFDASVVSTRYDYFTLTDYIDTNYFRVENENAVKASEGIIVFDKEEQKITWTIDYLKTRSHPVLTIDIIRKDDSVDQELFPTNIMESVAYRLDEIEEIVESDKTPILKGNYKLVYEENAPSGCTVSGIPTSSVQNVFDTVAISDVVPTCDGYQFKGWEIVTENVYRINDDYFIMPESDVVLRAEWSSLSVSKLMDGKVYEYTPPVIRKVSEYDEEDIWNYSYRSSITKIVFQNSPDGILNAVESFDISETKDARVIAYVVANEEDSSTYTVYIQGDIKVIANDDSSNLFSSFSKLESIEGLEYFDTSNVINMSRMFSSCSNLTSLDLSTFNTSSVADMSNMFAYCAKLGKLDLSNFDTSSVTTMVNMFSECPSLKTLNLSHFNTSSVTDMGRMFYKCYDLSNLNLSGFDTSNVTSMVYMFSRCGAKQLDLSGFDTSSVTNMVYMFEGSYCTDLDVSNFDTRNVVDMNHMFYNCKLTILDLSSFVTPRVTDMSYMFQTSAYLTNLNVSNFDTTNVKSMAYMFNSCGKLLDLDLSSFVTSNVTTMENMFKNCNSLSNVVLNNFDTSRVTNMDSMFDDCSSLLKLDLSNFVTPRLTNMRSMFYNCRNLLNLNLSHFDTSSVTNMYQIFSGCSSLVNLDLSSFVTSRVTTMEWMFSGCTSLMSLNIDYFDTSNVTNMYAMFNGCNNLTTTINVYNPNTTSLGIMFSNAATLSGAQITVNYIESTSTLVDQMIATKSSNSNVVKGKVVSEYSISTGDSVISDVTRSLPNKLIHLSSSLENYAIISFKLNGNLVKGTRFVMPNEDVVITDVVLVETVVVESEHYPYPDSLNDVVYGEKIFEGASSLTVTLEYQTQSVYADYIYLYDSNGKEYGKYGGVPKNTEIITIPGNYIKIVFRTDMYANNFYGFKATILPNYD